MMETVPASAEPPSYQTKFQRPMNEMDFPSDFHRPKYRNICVCVMRTSVAKNPREFSQKENKRSGKE